MKATARPSDILLVVDAMTGQEAAALVKSFNASLELTGTCRSVHGNNSDAYPRRCVDQNGWR